MSISVGIGLKDMFSGPAKNIASGMTNAARQAKTLQSAMTSLQSQMTKAAALGDAGKLAKAQGQYAAFHSALERLQPTLRGEAQLADNTRNSLSEVGEAAGALVGPMSAAIGVLAAVATALAAATIAGAKLALEMTELREKTVTLFEALGGEGSGERTLGMIDALRAKLGLTRAELVPLTEQLMSMGVQGAALKKQLTAVASVKALGVNGGEEEYIKILQKLQGQSKVSSKDLSSLFKTGVNVSEIAAKLGVSVKQLQQGLKAGTIDASKFGDALTDAVIARGMKPLEQQSKAFTTQLALAREQFGQLFENVDVKPFLDAFKFAVSIIDQGSASGRALKFLITQAFDTIFKVAAKVLPYIKAYFLGLEIGALRVYIALKPAIAKLNELFAGPTDRGTITAIGETVASFSNFLVILAKGIVLTMRLWDVLAPIAGAINDAFAPGRSVVENFISGLVDGIRSGTGLVIDAVRGLGGDMLDALKDVLHIHSPSRAMMKLGVGAASGFALGIRAGNDNATGAASSLGQQTMRGVQRGFTDRVGVPSSLAASALERPHHSAVAGAAPSSGSKSVTVHVAPGAIVIQGAQGSATELTESAVTLIFERIALEEGLGTAA